MKKLKKTLAVLVACTTMMSGMISAGTFASASSNSSAATVTSSSAVGTNINEGAEFNAENWLIQDQYADYNYYNKLSDYGVLMKANYNDEFFDVKASEESPELAKFGVMLAAAASDPDSISGICGNLGFTYFNRNYGNDELSDEVAFTLGVKKAGNKNIFMLAVRDTENGNEWYSNFNTGDGDTHAGYADAAAYVIDYIKQYVDEFASADGSARNVILVTGNGKGAAVSNIIAAELSVSGKYFTAEDVFGYTYNCPAVSKSADQSLKNIRNYNTYSNMPSLLPLEQQGYKRNGIDITVDKDSDVYKNFLYQYSRKNYIGYIDADASEILDSIAKNTGNADNQHSKEDMQFAYGVLADCLSSDKYMPLFEEKLGNRLAQYNCSDYTKSVCKTFVNLLAQSDKAVSADALIDGVSEGYDERIKDLINLYDSCKSSIAEWDAYVRKCEADEIEPDFNDFYNRNGNYYAMLLAETNDNKCYGIEELSDSLNKLDRIIESYNFFKTKFDAFCFLFSALTQNTPYNTQGYNVFDIADNAVYSRNTADAGYLLINSMYYGHEGWYEYPVQNVIIPDNIKRIGSYCFFNNKDLKELVIPDSAEMIDSYALGGCVNISKLTVPADVCSKAYFDAENLMSVHFTYGRTGIMPDFEKNYAGLWTNDYESIIRNARSTLSTVTFDDSIQYIGTYTFDGCEKLYNVKLPASLKTIGNYAFANCVNLTDMVLPEGVYELKTGAFSKCEGLAVINLPDSIKLLGDSCFSGDISLVIDKLPSNITKIGDGCFRSIKGFNGNTLVIPASVKNIGPSTLANVKVEHLALCCDVKLDLTYEGFYENLKELTIVPGESTVVDYYDNHYLCSPFVRAYNLEIINISEGITEIAEDAFAGSYTREVLLPDTVTKISDRAFSVCGKLAKINIPESVTYIGDHAITYGQFEEITLPSGLEHLGAGAFYNCQKLKSITVPSGVRGIGNGTFSSCTLLENINVPFDITSVGEYAFSGTKITRAFIPEGQETIEHSTFSFCKNLETVFIPESVNTIENDAFSFCTNLSDVYYGGSETEWQNAVRLIKDDNELNGAVIHYNSDTSFTIGNIENLKTSSITSNSVKLSWDKVVNAKNYNVELYKNGNWTKLAAVSDNSYTVTGLDEGTEYKFRVNANKTSPYNTAVNGAYTEVSATTAVNSSAEFNGNTMSLGGSINVNFYVLFRNIPLEQLKKSYVEFTVNGKTQTAKFDAGKMNGDKTKYGFTCVLNSVSLADDINAVLYYYDANGTKHSTSTIYTAQTYLNTAIAKSTNAKMVTLAKSINDYGYYMQKYLSKTNGWTIGKDHVGMAQAYTTESAYSNKGNTYLSELSSYQKTVDLNADIAKVNYSLSLDSDTAINVKIAPDANYTGSIKATVDGKSVALTKQSDGRYALKIANIPAHELSTMHTIEITTAKGISTYNVSALSFAYDCINAGTSNAERYNAACAFYEYYKAAKAYKG